MEDWHIVSLKDCASGRVKYIACSRDSSIDKPIPGWLWLNDPVSDIGKLTKRLLKDREQISGETAPDDLLGIYDVDGKRCFVLPLSEQEREKVHDAERENRRARYGRILDDDS